MRNFDFYRTAALAVGAMLAASVALTSCKKDETTPAPITPETLKQLNELMREGYYGAVKSVTNTTYTNLKPTVPDS
jgi:7-cyano-7-deazaguanine synthase in queuosine biosynthesis